jgi:hypothetical protein
MTCETKDRAVEDLDLEITREIHNLADRFSAQILADFWQQNSMTLFSQVAHWKARWASVSRRYTHLQITVVELEKELVLAMRDKEGLLKDLQVSQKAHSDALEKIKRLKAEAKKGTEGGSNGV